MHNKKIHMVAFLLLVVGGINWLLEAFGFGIGQYLPSTVGMILYILIGLSAIYELVTHKHHCNSCAAGSSAPVAEDISSGM